MKTPQVSGSGCVRLWLAFYSPPNRVLVMVSGLVPKTQKSVHSWMMDEEIVRQHMGPVRQGH